ncbi:hypothetical protein QJQ45_023605 [Haematococcus lacustris]|nr:hypothetical protein QJQ45_023605 [Haematococcus lacustris]
MLIMGPWHGPCTCKNADVYLLATTLISRKANMSNVNVSSSPSSLTEELKIASRRIHSLSNSLLNARLIVLFTDRKLYARAISCFYYIFEALDAALAGAVNKESALQPFASLLPDLYRHEAFATDLELFLGKDWRAACPPSPQVLKYTQHLAQLAAEQPTLLLAHSFTQHLAVLSGGQIIKRAARKKLRLAEQEGTAAYEYKASPSQLKQAFCSALDAWGAGQSAEMRQLMVAEHKAAFAFNNDIISSFRIGWGPFLKGSYPYTCHDTSPPSGCSARCAIDISQAAQIRLEKSKPTILAVNTVSHCLSLPCVGFRNAGVALLVPASARIPLVAVGLCGAIAYSGHQLMARGR